MADAWVSCMQLRMKIEPLHGGSIIIHLADRVLTSETSELSAVYRTVQSGKFLSLAFKPREEAQGQERRSGIDDDANPGV